MTDHVRWHLIWPLLGSLGIGVLVHLGLVAGVDRAIVRFVQTPEDCRLMNLSAWVSAPFSAESTVLWCIGLTLGLGRRGAGRLACAPWLVLATIPVELLGKIVVSQPYVPTLTWPALAGCPVEQPLIDISTPGTFPSGHSIRAGYFAVLAAIFVQRARVSWWPWTALIALGVIVMAWGRLYASTHWPSDVIAGLLIGTFVAFIVADLLARSPARLSPTITAPDRVALSRGGPR